MPFLKIGTASILCSSEFYSLFIVKVCINYDGKRALTLKLSSMASARLERKLVGGLWRGEGCREVGEGKTFNCLFYGQDVSQGCLFVILRPFNKFLEKWIASMLCSCHF